MQRSRRIQEDTGGYRRRIQEDSGGYRRIQEDTRGYNRIQEDTGGFFKLWIKCCSNLKLVRIFSSSREHFISPIKAWLSCMNTVITIYSHLVSRPTRGKIERSIRPTKFAQTWLINECKLTLLLRRSKNTKRIQDVFLINSLSIDSWHLFYLEKKT